MTDTRLCEVEGCTKPPRSSKAALCPMHYHRQYRHGNVSASARSGFVVQSQRRYRRVSAPGHPLAGQTGKVYAHRLALHEKIGPGEHPCHWCGKTVTWQRGLSPTALIADHLNRDTSDNSPSNLVPACQRCNSGRGLTLRHEAIRQVGFWSGVDTIARGRGRALIGASEGQ